MRMRTFTVKLLRKWLQAGVMDEGRFSETVSGTPQGGVISPLLSNIYLHYLDAVWEVLPVAARTSPAAEAGQPAMALIWAACWRRRSSAAVFSGPPAFSSWAAALLYRCQRCSTRWSGSRLLGFSPQNT
jgi:hypothetical protein